LQVPVKEEPEGKEMVTVYVIQIAESQTALDKSGISGFVSAVDEALLRKDPQ
jgi:hypothetical protein